MVALPFYVTLPMAYYAIAPLGVIALAVTGIAGYLASRPAARDAVWPPVTSGSAPTA